MCGHAGWFVTWAPLRRAGSLLPILSHSLESQSLASLSPAQVFEDKEISAWRIETWELMSVFIYPYINLQYVCTSNRRQWLWKPQHIIQLQRDLHKLLWHQTLNLLSTLSVIYLPSSMLASRGYLCCNANTTTHKVFCQVSTESCIFSSLFLITHSHHISQEWHML